MADSGLTGAGSVRKARLNRELAQVVNWHLASRSGLLRRTAPRSEASATFEQPWADVLCARPPHGGNVWASELHKALRSQHRGIADAAVRRDGVVVNAVPADPSATLNIALQSGSLGRAWSAKG